MTTEKIIRCKAFPNEGVRKNRIAVFDGAVKVYDSVAGHFTSCHSLSNRTMAKIRKQIQRIGDHNGMEN